jgi:hypothetical protein
MTVLFTPTRRSTYMATAKATTARRTTTANVVCPECGRTFARPAALGAHRQRAHGVAGSSKNATARRATAAAASRSARRQATRRPSTNTRTGSPQTVDRDKLLRVLFPDGIPPKQETISAVNEWLDQADTLARRA